MAQAKAKTQKELSARVDNERFLEVWNNAELSNAQVATRLNAEWSTAIRIKARSVKDKLVKRPGGQTGSAVPMTKKEIAADKPAAKATPKTTAKTPAKPKAQSRTTARSTQSVAAGTSRRRPRAQESRSEPFTLHVAYQDEEQDFSAETQHAVHDQIKSWLSSLGVYKASVYNASGEMISLEQAQSGDSIRVERQTLAG